MAGYADVLIGLQYGDEGKARVVDMIAKDYDIIARFNGGANAGHSIETDDGLKVALNQVPSGIFHSNTLLYSGSGCVIDFPRLAKEIANLEDLGIDLTGRFFISPQATVVQPSHYLIDGIGGGEVGTTKKGIGPAYADKAYRMLGTQLKNIRTGDMVDDPEGLFMVMRQNLKDTIQAYRLDASEIEPLMEDQRRGFEAVKKYILDDPLFLEKKVREGNSVLFEGAQSAMLDVTKGYVPFVTSSQTIAAAAFTGGDLPPHYHRKTIGIAKAVMSRVGHGPFPSEFGGKRSESYCMEANADGSPRYGQAIESAYDLEALLMSEDPFEVGQAMRVLSHEYGTVSTRPRRVGSFDLALLDYTIRTNGVDELFITKCDTLNVYSRTTDAAMPVTVGYKLDDQVIDYVPATTLRYYRAEPVIEFMEAFSEDITDVRKEQDLPAALLGFIKRVEHETGTKVIGIGTGPRRNQAVYFE